MKWLKEIVIIKLLLQWMNFMKLTQFYTMKTLNI
jgi:hypothetical protein